MPETLTRLKHPVDLDITPMIDLIFLLLMFFLVASSPDRQAEAHLPKARHGAGVTERHAIIFSIGQGGLQAAPVYFGDIGDGANQLAADYSVQSDQIEQYVREAVQQGRSNVLIKADEGAAHRDVARVARAASRVAGIKLHFAVLEVD
jgi:biopolymer transport protein ExbD